MRRSEKGRGYSCIAISLYDEDAARIDAKVAELRARGLRRANRSMLVRAAIAAFDPSRADMRDLIAADGIR